MSSFFRDKLRGTRKDDASSASSAAAREQLSLQELHYRHTHPHRRSRTRKNQVGNARKYEAVAGAQSSVNLEHASLVESMVKSLNHLSTKQGSVLDHYRIEEELGRGSFARKFMKNLI